MPKPRKPAEQTPLKTLKILCEGEKTEPNYLNGYIKALDNSARKSVVEIEPTSATTAVELVDAAIKLKESPSSLPNDEFWVVYDRESVAKYSDALHATARKKADGAGIQIAMCNVCFEYWFLIHFVDTDRPYSNCEDVLKNSPFRSEFKKEHGCDYEKSSGSMFQKLEGRLAEARKRALRLNGNGKQNAAPTKIDPHHINPYVGIVELLDAIDNFE